MNKTTAIKKYCIECAGDSAKEVTMCHILDCPLWSFRLGNSIKSKAYQKRVSLSRERYPEDWKEIDTLLAEYGGLSKSNAPKGTVFGEKRATGKPFPNITKRRTIGERRQSKGGANGDDILRAASPSLTLDGRGE